MGGAPDDQPHLEYGPDDPAKVTADSQPDWYLGSPRACSGSCRASSPTSPVTPSPGTSSSPARCCRWPCCCSSSWCWGRSWRPGCAGTPASTTCWSGPATFPPRTAFLAAMVAEYGLLWAAGGNDILATKLHLSVNSITYVMRVAVLLGPVLVFLLVRRLCVGLQRVEAEELAARPGDRGDPAVAGGWLQRAAPPDRRRPRLHAQHPSGRRGRRGAGGGGRRRGRAARTPPPGAGAAVSRLVGRGARRPPRPRSWRPRTGTPSTRRSWRRGSSTRSTGTSSTTTSSATPRQCPCGVATVGRTATDRATGALVGRRCDPVAGAESGQPSVATSSGAASSPLPSSMAYDRAGDQAADDRGQDEQPELDDGVASGEERRPRGARRVTEQLVMGMSTRWIGVKHRPMAIPATPVMPRVEVAPRITIRKTKGVITTSGVRKAPAGRKPAGECAPYPLAPEPARRRAVPARGADCATREQHGPRRGEPPTSWASTSQGEHVLAGEPAAGGEPDGDRGVDVRAGDVADGVGHGEHGEAEGQRDAVEADSLPAMTAAPQPPKTSQNVPRNSAAIRRGMGCMGRSTFLA